MNPEIFKYSSPHDLQVEKDSLLNLVRWYAEEYHKRDHADVVDMINNATTQESLDLIWQITDSWLDY